MSRRTLWAGLAILLLLGGFGAYELIQIRGDIRALRDRLDEVERSRVLRIDERIVPVNDEKTRESLRRVLAATVFIEKEIVFREEGTDRFLHKEGTGGERLRPVTNASDLEVAAGETGSGFCVLPDGRILTSAHVVGIRAGRSPAKLGAATLVREAVVHVVFSGTSERRTARVVRVADEGDDDFALLKIEPFADMPYVAGFRVDVDPPGPGSAVRVFGFPLGKRLRQEKGRVTGSIFAGMVSRIVDPYVQIQGVVYPGLSGGPVIDSQGRVVGLVTAVQKGANGEIASDIGFVLPVRRLEKRLRRPVK